MSRKVVGTGFLAGVIAALVAGLGMLGLRSFLDAPSLQELIAERLLIYLSPTAFEFLLQRVWSLGKVLSVAGVTFLLAVAGGVLGVLVAYLRSRLAPSLRIPSPALAPVLAGALWLAANTALLPLLKGGFWGADVPGDAIAFQAVLLGGFGLYAGLLTLAFGALLDGTATRQKSYRGIDRRTFLVGSIGGLAAAAAVASGLRFLIKAGAHGASGLAAVHEEPGEMPAEITPVSSFYQVTKNLVDPTISASSWRLSVQGAVETPFSLTLADLRNLPSAEEVVTLECIENPVGGRLISNARWRGVPLKDLLQRAGLQTPEGTIVFRSADGYDESLPATDAMRPEVLLAYEMNGEPLTREHGFPARLLVPGRYGMKNPKWLVSITAIPAATYSGFWQERGWDSDAVVKTTSQIIVPRSLDPVVAGREWMAGGLAYGGDRGITRVRVSTDGGKTWSEANLSPPLSPYSWVLWTNMVFLDAEHRTLVVRATDAAGVEQSAVETDAAPSGATGLHSRQLFSLKESS